MMQGQLYGDAGMMKRKMFSQLWLNSSIVMESILSSDADNRYTFKVNAKVKDFSLKAKAKDMPHWRRGTSK